MIFDCHADQPCKIANVQFFHQFCAMFFNRFFADKQHFTDLCAGMFLCNQLQDFLFTWRQVGEWVAILQGRMWVDGAFHNDLGDRDRLDRFCRLQQHALPRAVHH